MSSEDLSRFQHLSYERFRAMATDPALSAHERIGFPDSYRGGKTDVILADIVAKLPALESTSRVVVDVGSGGGELAQRLIALCQRQGHKLHLVDSAEMLAHLPDRPGVRKVVGLYPDQCAELIDALEGQVDVLLSYSVFHYVFEEGNSFAFLDQSLRLLAPGGRFLLGDLPNSSQRKRFFATPRGEAFHREFIGTDEAPVVRFNNLEPGTIDDAVLVALILRCRAAGFDAYWMPQRSDLPMSNRREDLLVIRP